MKFQTAFGPKRKVDLVFPDDEESLTLQSCQDECDINAILARWEKTGVLEHQMSFSPEYGDFSDVTDYQSAINQVNAANEHFASLPASVRDFFANNPASFLSFTDDPANEEKMIELGLIERPVSVVEPTIPKESNQNTDA